MKKTMILLGVVLALASCEGKQAGPPLLSECNYSEPILLKVVEYDNESDLKAYYEKFLPDMRKEDYKILGFATHSLKSNIHTLHVMKVRGQTDHERIETLGHELMHSFCNEWHSPVIRG